MQTLTWTPTPSSSVVPDDLPEMDAQQREYTWLNCSLRNGVDDLLTGCLMKAEYSLYRRRGKGRGSSLGSPPRALILFTGLHPCDLITSQGPAS